MSIESYSSNKNEQEAENSETKDNSVSEEQESLSWDEATEQLDQIKENNAMKVDGLPKSEAWSQENNPDNQFQSELNEGYYNENQGVIIFKRDGETYATPATDKVRKTLSAAQFQKDESAGVPHLNDSSYYRTGTDDRAAERWRGLRAFGEE